MVLNQAVARSYLTDEENSAQAKNDRPVLVLLGGDDGRLRDSKNNTQGRCDWSLLEDLHCPTTPLFYC